MSRSNHPDADDSHPISFAKQAMRRLQDSELYRALKSGRIDRQYITIDGTRLLNMCSNDYLGMASSGLGPALKHGAEPAGSGPSDKILHDDAGVTQQMQSSSRLLSGSDPLHARLEDELAASKSYESALLYPTGYMANTGVIPVLADTPGSDKNGGDAGHSCVIFSDALNHASIIDGCRLAAKAHTIIYNHNDLYDLEEKIAESADRSQERHARKIIITEGVFSMDGDIAPLRGLSRIARRHGAILAVDDAHGDFVMGNDGRGTPNHLGLGGPGGGVDVYTSSLSKGLGSFGGYVASDASVIDLCVNLSRQFIYTSALPTQIVHHASERLGRRDLLRQRRRRLAENTRMLADAIESAGYEAGSDTHIIPVIIGDEGRATRIAQHMYKNGVYVPAIRYPTVPHGKARLRMSATAWLEDSDIVSVWRALKSAASL